MDRVDCVIAGAGVIGLAVARELAASGHAVLVVDAADTFGTGTSSRNSEVVHGGMYYPSGSNKARLCVQGRELLYQYCESRHVPVRRLGKLIVATEASGLAQLEGIAAQAQANGVHDLIWCDRAAVAQLEPALRAHAALLSPSTGIIDSHAYMQALHADACAAGADFVFRTPLAAAEPDTAGWVLQFGGSEPVRLGCRWLINAAGLGAIGLARHIKGLSQADLPQAWLCKGSYASLSGRSPFSHLIYPLPPDEASLGIHLTLDMAGNARFGPDVEWMDQEDYAVDGNRIAGFEAAVRQYWPGLPAGVLVPAYAGIRPKLHGPGMAAADFVLQGPAGHGLPGLVNLFGMESPGLTASLAIAREVRERLMQEPSVLARPEATGG